MDVPEIYLSITLPIEEKKLFEIIDKKGLKIIRKKGKLYVSNGRFKALIERWYRRVEIKVYGECTDENDKVVGVDILSKALKEFSDIVTKLYEGWLECH